MNEYWQEVARELVLQARVPGFYSDEDLPTWIGKAIATLEEAVRVSEATHA